MLLLVLVSIMAFIWAVATAIETCRAEKTGWTDEEDDELFEGNMLNDESEPESESEDVEEVSENPTESDKIKTT